jgi:hypothetical protein
MRNYGLNRGKAKALGSFTGKATIASPATLQDRQEVLKVILLVKDPDTGTNFPSILNASIITITYD